MKNTFNKLKKFMGSAELFESPYINKSDTHSVRYTIEKEMVVTVLVFTIKQYSVVFDDALDDKLQWQVYISKETDPEIVAIVSEIDPDAIYALANNDDPEDQSIENLTQAFKDLNI